MATLNVSRFAGSWQAPHTPQINQGTTLANGLFFHAAMSEQGENAAHDAVSSLHQSSGIIHPGLSPAGYGRFRSDTTSNLQFGFFDRQKVSTGPLTMAAYGRLETSASANNLMGNGNGTNQFRILTNYNGSGGSSGYLDLLTYDGSAITDFAVASVIDPNANHWYVCVRRLGGVFQIWRDAVLMGESSALTMRDVSGSTTNPMQVGWSAANSAGRAITRASAWNRALMPAEIAALALDPDILTAQRRAWVPVTVSDDTSSSLSGGVATADAGTLATSRTVAASGQAATASSGTIAPSLTIALSGQSVTASAGTVTQSKAAALSGQAVTASAGTLGETRTVSLSGQAATASAGTITYTADGNVTLALSGQAVAASAGTVAPAATVATSGQAATVSAGIAVAGRSIAASGTQITTAAGTLTLGIVVPLAGQAAAAGAGTVAYSTAGAVVVALTGQAVEASAGTMSYAEAILSAAPIGRRLAGITRSDRVSTAVRAARNSGSTR